MNPHAGGPDSNRRVALPFGSLDTVGESLFLNGSFEAANLCLRDHLSKEDTCEGDGILWRFGSLDDASDTTVAAAETLDGSTWTLVVLPEDKLCRINAGTCDDNGRLVVLSNEIILVSSPSSLPLELFVKEEDTDRELVMVDAALLDISVSVLRPTKSVPTNSHCKLFRTRFCGIGCTSIGGRFFSI